MQMSRIGARGAPTSACATENQFLRLIECDKMSMEKPDFVTDNALRGGSDSPSLGTRQCQNHSGNSPGHDLVDPGPNALASNAHR